MLTSVAGKRVSIIDLKSGTGDIPGMRPGMRRGRRPGRRTVSETRPRNEFG
jgi:hypothetical protein